MTATALTVNLSQTNYVTDDHPVPPGADRATVDIQPNATDGWGVAVVGMQWKTDDGTIDEMAYRDMDPVITFSTSTPARLGVSVAGATHVILKTTTVDGTADAAAPYVIRFT